MSGYQRLPESNDYPGNASNAASPPPAYPQIDYSNNNRNVAPPMNQQNYQQPLLQPQPTQSPYQQPQYQYAQQPQQYQSVQPSPYAQPLVGTYAVPPQDAAAYQPYQAQPLDGQPLYNAYGYPTYPAAAPAIPVGYAQPIGVLQPGVPGHIVRGQWSDSVCDCFSHIPSCLLTCFFPCIRWAQTIKRANLMSFWGAFALYTLPALAAFCISIYFSVVSSGDSSYYDRYGYYHDQNDSLFVPLYAVLVITNTFVVILGATFRSKLRAKYQINGSGCEDCFWHFCCSCCAIAQEARHVDRDLGLAI